MKIGYVVKYFHPIKGGAEGNILNLALEAVKDGHEVHVFTSNRKGDQKLEKLEDEYKGIRIHRCKTWFDFSLYMGFYPSLLIKVLKADLDIVHASGFGFIWYDVVLLLKRLFSSKLKFINTPHGPFMALSDYPLILRIVRNLYGSIQKIFLNWLYDAVIQVNTFQWQWIVEYGIEKSKVSFVPNGVPEFIVQNEVTENELVRFCEKYSIPETFVISSLGRISKYKGIQHVIRALAKIEKEFIFLVMGRDEGFLRNLKVLAQKENILHKVRFIPDISEKEKTTALTLSDVFVFSSQWEAFGIVLLEAMANSNAIISTKTEGGKFIVTPSVNGLLYDFADVKTLRKHLTDLMEQPELVSKMQKENRARVKKFLWHSIYMEHYKPLIENLGKLAKSR